nr:retrovirus-related Pol polyprotein from transposon TNT 1-94 [Tanacetum cinerariifolium]
VNRLIPNGKETLALESRFNLGRTSLTGFPAQSIRSSNAIALDSPYLLVLITGTSQSRQHDADQARCIDSHKRTFGGNQFLGDKLVSRMSKKQNCTAMSSAEAKYVATEYQLADMFTKALPENHNLFLVGQFCDAYLEVAFRKSTCFVRDLQDNDLLIGNRGSDIYIISLQESTSSTQLCLMAKATPTQAWLWHRRLSHFNFDYINLLSKKDIVIGLPKLKYVKDQLCSSCELSKANRSSFKSKAVSSSKEG